MTLLYIVIGWVVGIALATTRPELNTLIPLFIVGGLILTFAARRDFQWRSVALAVIAVGLGMYRYQSAQPTPTEDHLIFYNDKGYAEMIGVVIDAPDVRDNAQRLRVEIQSIKQGRNSEKLVKGLALINTPRFSDIQYGDRLFIQGEPVTPPSFESLNIAEDGQLTVDAFSYRDYLARSGVYSFIPFSKITIPELFKEELLKVAVFDIKNSKPSRNASNGIEYSIFSPLIDLRNRSQELISQLLPSPQSGLLSGILLGNDNDIPPDVKDAFNRTGTSHIVAISGFNITIVAGFLFSVFGRLTNKRWATILTVLGIAVYALFIGGNISSATGSSVIRAAFMGVVAIGAERFGRRGNGLTALAFSVWLITLFNPNSLFDLGLVLSASATLGLILYAQPLTDFTEKLLKRLFADETAGRLTAVISDAVLLTTAAQITTLPIIFLVFGRFSVVSFLTNALVLPVQAPIMGLGVLALITGILWFPAGQVLAWIVGLPLSYTLSVIRAMAQWPDASIAVTPEPSVITLYYVILFGATAVLSQPEDRCKTFLERTKGQITAPLVAVTGVAIALIVWAIVMSRPDGKLHVWFLAVGEGSATLIQTPNGAHILVDGGENPTQLRTALGDRLPFYKRDIDLLIVTQPHNKTITALPPLFERYNVKAAITNGQSADNDTYRALMSSLTDDNTEVVAAVAGYSATTNDGVVIEVLNPAQMPEVNANPNDAPLILRLSFGKASFILTTEISEKGMKSFVEADSNLYATVLQLAANGAEKQNPAAWLNSVEPEVAVIHAETGNKSAQPDDSVLKQLDDTRIFRTDRHGTIEIVTDGNQLFITPGRQ